MGIKQESVDRLGKILGGVEVLSGKGPGTASIKKAVEKIAKEQAEANEAEAEKLIRAALTIHNEAKTVEKQFNSNMAKINKNFDKAIKAVERLGNGGGQSEDDSQGQE